MSIIEFGLQLFIAGSCAMCVELHVFGGLSLITSLFVLRIQLWVLRLWLLMRWRLLVLRVVRVCYVLSAVCWVLLVMCYVLDVFCCVFYIIDCY